MAAIQAKQFLTRVEQGETLSTEDRRHVIGYLMTVEPERAGTAELAALFNTNDRIIRRDKAAIKEELALAFKNDGDVASRVIFDVDSTYQNKIREAEKALKLCESPSNLHLKYLLAITSLTKEYTELMQSMGMVPKNLGTHTEKKFVFEATVSKDDGSVTVRDSRIIDAEIVDPEREKERREDEEIRRRYDAEFGDKPQLPPASVDGQRTN